MLRIAKFDVPQHLISSDLQKFVEITKQECAFSNDKTLTKAMPKNVLAKARDVQKCKFPCFVKSAKSKLIITRKSLSFSVDIYLLTI